jgi:hypothetical protein
MDNQTASADPVDRGSARRAGSLGWRVGFRAGCRSPGRASGYCGWRITGGILTWPEKPRLSLSGVARWAAVEAGFVQRDAFVRYRHFFAPSLWTIKRYPPILSIGGVRAAGLFWGAAGGPVSEPAANRQARQRMLWMARRWCAPGAAQTLSAITLAIGPRRALIPCGSERESGLAEEIGGAANFSLKSITLNPALPHAEGMPTP